MLFVTAAAMLVSLSAILIVNLSGAINTLMEQAKTPHFVQMHSGEVDRDRLAQFAERNRYVDDFQMVEFLNVDGSKIMLNGESLAGDVQDIGFSTQSEKFDYLLDLDGHVIKVSSGEVYVPAGYMKNGTAKTGDTIIVDQRPFVVAGFLRDSQMNSMLASSKRFLISEDDYATIQNAGKVEYLIEFRLKYVSDIGAFEKDYISRGLEANGPTITYPLFKILNAISDGLMIAVILLVSVLVGALALMCIRFTLLATIEDDYREIGVMKGIGVKVRLAVSWWRAMVSGEWHRQNGEQPQAHDISDKYDYEAINHLLTECMIREAAIAEFFAEEGIVPLTIFYEDFALQYEETVMKVLEYLELPVENITVSPPAFERIVDDIAEQWVQRFRKERQKGWDRVAW